MESWQRFVLGALLPVSIASGLLLGAQAAGAAASSTPAPTVTNAGGGYLSTAGGNQNFVFVSGTNFVDVTAVDFGGVPGTDVQCYNGDECSVIAPPRATAGTVYVTVTAAGGTSAIYDGYGDETTYYYPTNITATPALLSLSPLHLGLFTLTATVTGVNGAPVAGMPVKFFTEVPDEDGNYPEPAVDWCTTTTNSAGVATCSALTGALTLIEDNGYTAFAEGSSTQLEAATNAPLLSL